MSDVPGAGPTELKSDPVARVEAFTITLAESTSRRKRCAWAKFSVTIASVC